MKPIPFPFRWPKRGDTGLEDQCKRKKYLHILAHHIILRDNSHVEVPIGREKEGVFVQHCTWLQRNSSCVLVDIRKKMNGEKF